MFARYRVFSMVVVLHVALAAEAARKPVIRERTELAADATSWSQVLPAGSRIDIKGVRGGVIINRSPDDRVTVTMERDPGPLAPRMELVTHDKGVTLCALYASPNPKRQNECVPGAAGRMTEGFKPDHPAVRFRVSVPEGVEVFSRVIHGDMTADAGAVNLDLATNDGNVAIRSTGRVVQVHVTAAGNIDLALGPNPEERHVRLTTQFGSGRISVAVPPGRTFYSISSRYRIETPWELEAAAIPESWLGTIGGGSGKTLFLTIDAGLKGRVALRPSPAAQ